MKTAVASNQKRAGRQFLWKLRFALHVLTGRREDRLLFEGDMPHAEAREGAKQEFLDRTDLSEDLKWKILSDNGRCFLGL